MEYFIVIHFLLSHADYPAFNLSLIHILIRYCEQTSLKTLVVPEMEELRGGNMKRSVREIRIEDLFCLLYTSYAPKVG